MVLAQPVIDGGDEREARRILREGELEMRTVMMEIEQKMAEAERLLRDAEAQAERLREPGRQSRESLVLAGALGGIALLMGVAGGGALSCLALPIALYALYVQREARQQLAEENRQRQAALYQIKKRKLAEVERIEEQVKQLQSRLAAGPASAR